MHHDSALASPPPIYQLTYATPLIFLLCAYGLITSSHVTFMAALFVYYFLVAPVHQTN